MKILFSILILLCGVSASAQLTTKDFKIYIDGFATPDSNHLLQLTKEELMTIKELHTNFAWGTIKSFIVYFSGTSEYSDAVACPCPGAVLCTELNKYFVRCGPGSVITFVPQVINGGGKEVSWTPLSVILK